MSKRKPFPNPADPVGEILTALLATVSRSTFSFFCPLLICGVVARTGLIARLGAVETLSII